MSKYAVKAWIIVLAQLLGIAILAALLIPLLWLAAISEIMESLNS